MLNGLDNAGAGISRICLVDIRLLVVRAELVVSLKFTYWHCVVASTGVSTSLLPFLCLLLRQSAQLISRCAQAPWICSSNQSLTVHSDLLAVLEEHEGWHRRDLVRLSDILCLVYIDLGEPEHTRDAVFFRKIGVYWRDRFAWSTPVCVEVDGDVGGVREELLELRGGVDMVK
jgi:hypothetical protein